jgi:hypothetical protein
MILFQIHQTIQILLLPTSQKQILDIHGALKVKLKYTNKKTKVLVSRVFIS